MDARRVLRREVILMCQALEFSVFSDDFRFELDRLIRLRRDVRRFRTDLIEQDLLTKCLDTFNFAPSVGLSEPWRIVHISSEKARATALSNFTAANAEALDGYAGDRAKLYAGLKLSGMQEAPVQLAVYSDMATQKGAGLGVKTMPEMRQYSVVAAVTQFWLAARAEGLGVGWVSILDPVALGEALSVPQDWALVAYLCVGWPEDEGDKPELECAGWEARSDGVSIEIR